MISADLYSPCDLHGRKAIYINQLCEGLSSLVFIEFKDRRINVKSLLGLLSLNLKKDDSFLLQIFGNHEEADFITVLKGFEHLIET